MREEASRLAQRSQALHLVLLQGPVWPRPKGFPARKRHSGCKLPILRLKEPTRELLMLRYQHLGQRSQSFLLVQLLLPKEPWVS